MRQSVQGQQSVTVCINIITTKEGYPSQCQTKEDKTRITLSDIFLYSFFFEFLHTSFQKETFLKNFKPRQQSRRKKEKSPTSL
jgi:hypothetical protein